MLSVDRLSKRFGDFEMADVTFEVEEGEYFVLLGPSGTGKTVLLETLTGMTPADSGSIVLGGKDVTREKVQKRGLGLVFQDQALFPHMDVAANIAYGLHGKTGGGSRREERVRRLADEMEVGDLLRRMPATLSGGEAQRVALARALAAEPRCLLLDEPLSSLDRGARGKMRSLLRRLNRRGLTMIHVTHDYEEALSLATRIGVMESGMLVQVGAPADIFRNPKSEFVADFIGIRNFFEGRVGEDGGSGAVFKTDTFRLFVAPGTTTGDSAALIRPEDVTISIERPDSSARNVIEGKVSDIFPVAGGMEVLVDIGSELAACITSDSVERLGLEPGRAVFASIKTSAVRILDR